MKTFHPLTKLRPRWRERVEAVADPKGGWGLQPPYGLQSLLEQGKQGKLEEEKVKREEMTWIRH